jgi:hypothetical protein
VVLPSNTTYGYRQTARKKHSRYANYKYYPPEKSKTHVKKKKLVLNKLTDLE